MPNLLCDLTQKASEVVCSNLIEHCTGNLLNRFSCLIEGSTSAECHTLGNAICDTFFTECPKVWLRQFALPIAIAGGVILTATLLCRPRR